MCDALWALRFVRFFLSVESRTLVGHSRARPRRTIKPSYTVFSAIISRTEMIALFARPLSSPPPSLRVLYFRWSLRRVTRTWSHDGMSDRSAGRLSASFAPSARRQQISPLGPCRIKNEKKKKEIDTTIQHTKFVPDCTAYQHLSFYRPFLSASRVPP